MTFISVPFIVGWLLVALSKPASSVILVCIGRIIIGKEKYTIFTKMRIKVQSKIA
jgi:hypothetical protein